jgi:ferritin
MISKTLQDAINEQINKEYASSYLYLSMAAYFENNGLPGSANWMYAQSDEEREHAMKLYEYLIDRGGKVELKAISAPQIDWKSAMDAFVAVYEHEQKVTKSIHDLYALAVKEQDYATQVTLQWFITEQVEEEKNALDIIENMKRIEERETGILMLDHRLAKRGKD